MKLHLLPERAGGAAENMAVDFLLLQRYPEGTAVRFRHYGWHRPAFTFGYAQKISFVREQIGGMIDFAAERVELCRRPTGGGIVDHRDDWTYALVIPRGHPLEDGRATQSYRLVHESLARALQAQGVPAMIKRADAADPSEAAGTTVAPADGARGGVGAKGAGTGVCFERAEIFDVVHEKTGRKIAGAAQKRNKRGLLFQGSIWRPAAGGDVVDWEAFGGEFVAGIAAALEVSAEVAPWPDWNEDELGALTEQYSSPEWIEFR